MMAANITIRPGDVFSQPADVVVLPCATNGALKDFARRTREDNDLPAPPEHLELGHLNVVDLSLESVPARRLVYAAVRDDRGSSPDVLRAVGMRLGELIVGDLTGRVVASPLLGTGAGRVPLVAAVEALTQGFRQRAPENGTLALFAPRLGSFRRLQRWYERWEREALQPPRVFLSYNKATQQVWVSALDERLQRQGIRPVFDNRDLLLTTELERWMQEEIARANRVVIVSDEAYATKADKQEGGVGYEAGVIAAELYRTAATGKFIPVIRSATLSAGTPRFLRGRLVIHCPSDEDTPAVLEEVVRAIYKADSLDEAGTRPIFL